MSTGLPIATLYATKEKSEVCSVLKRMPEEKLIAALLEILTLYFNDKNSSTLREYVLVTLYGFVQNTEKIGYNGYRQDGFSGGRHCEAKPINVRMGSEKKLSGGANFSDLTFARFEKYKKDNPMMIVGGFIEGRLIYSFSFPFNTEKFMEKLQAKLYKKFPDGKDIAGEYVRSATFSFDDYCESPDFSAKAHMPKNEIETMGLDKQITSKVYSYIHNI